MADRIYLDSSAYLSMLLGESRADDVERRTSGADVFSSVLLVLEAKRTLVRLSRERRISERQHAAAMERLQQDMEVFDLFDVSLDLCRSPTFPAVTIPRSLDLVHLRTALMYHDEGPLTAFLSLDERQLLAARELGLPA
jgi:hypothetical protein